MLYKILFCYKASSQQLKYYLGTDDNTTYNLRATTTLNATSAGGNGVVDSNPLFVGKKTGASTDYHWEGGLNNLVISNICWEGSNINSFFEVGNNKQHYLEKVIYSDITTTSYFFLNNYNFYFFNSYSENWFLVINAKNINNKAFF